MLEGRGSVLETARDVSRMLRDHHICGAIIGGVAATLHGHVQTTADVNAFVPEPLSAFAEHLRHAGYEFDARQREFRSKLIPVQLISPEQAVPTPIHFLSIDHVQTVSLTDLINLKLYSGTGSALRSQDIADAIALIQANQLDGRFLTRISKPLRPRVPQTG